jgi:fucose permease
MTLFQVTMVAALLVGGMGVALLGTIKVPLAARLHIDEAKVGGLVSLFGFTMIPVILTAGFLTDLIGRQMVFVSGSVLMTASLVVIGLTRTYPAALMAVILFSAAWSLLTNVGNVLTPLAFPGADPRDTAYATNLANVFFGLGAFLTPLGIPWLTRRFSLPAALTLVGGLALLPACLSAGVDFAALQPGSAGDATAAESTLQLFRDPMLWLFGLGLFFYGPLEASLAAWATTYLGEHQVKEGTAAMLLSAFWLMFMAARLCTALLLPPGAEALLIVVTGLLGAGLLMMMVLARQRGLAMALVPTTGFVLGPVFPTLIGILLAHFPPAVQGRAVGLFFAIGGIGWTLLPILIGTLARRTGVRRAFVLAVAFALGLSAIGAALRVMHGA